MSTLPVLPAATQTKLIDLARLIETGRVRRLGNMDDRHTDQPDLPGGQPWDSSDRPQPPPRWGLSLLFGRLVEISGHGTSAVLMAAMGLVREAQGLGEPVAWITPTGHSFFPPDAAAAGVDLDLLLVVRIRDGPDILRAADILLRSGGFGLVVSDWTRDHAQPGARLDQGRFRGAGKGRDMGSGRGMDKGLGLADQTRLAGLAKQHHAAFVCLTGTPADAPSLGALVSLRIDVTGGLRSAVFLHGGPDQHHFAPPVVPPAGVPRSEFIVRLRALKDKLGAPDWQAEERCVGPPGFSRFSRLAEVTEHERQGTWRTASRA